MKRAALLAALALSACGPMSPDRAADLCEERARAATGPTGEIGMGIGTINGAFNRTVTDTDVEIGVTSDYLQGRDPYVVYDECVREKSGQGPIRPLNLER